MSNKVVIGVYDSLAKAEVAELLLGDVHLPVGEEYLISADMEAGRVHGHITERGVADAVADAGVSLTKERSIEYEQLLQAGKLLLIFYGDDETVTKAYQALEGTDHEGLTLLGG
jgi:hypothetical protein